MAGLDTAWALDELRRFSNMTQVTRVERLGQATGHAPTLDSIVQQAAVVERILDRVTQDWRQSVPADSHDRWGRTREAAVRARALLERQTELEAGLGDDAPTLSAGALHPWVWEGARSLWASGHHAEAVAAAARKVNAETQNKVGRRDVAETDLVVQAFSDDGGRTAKSLRRGVRSFAEGCYAALRNPAAHDVAGELPEHEALEQLAAFSVLARWVDAATVATAA